MTATRDMSRAWSMMTVNWLVVAAISSFLACDSSTKPPTEPSPTPPVVEPPVVEPSFPVPESPLLEQPLSADVAVTIDARQLHQTMQGFGASMRIFSDPHLIAASGGIENALDISAADENAVLEMMFKEIGLTRLRPIHQSSLSQGFPGAVPRREWVFADGHIDLIRRSKDRGLKEWWLSPITLEPWMNDSNVDAYVDTAMDLIRYWKSKGVELTYYSIINEPSNAEVRVSADFVRTAVVLLGRRLRAEGLPTKIVIPDDVSPVAGALKARFVLEDPEARQYVGAIASHLYGGPISDMADMAEVAKVYGLPLWMSEWSLQDGRPMGWGTVVHEMIAEHDVSAVDYMWGFFGAHSQSSLVVIDHSSKRFAGARIAPAGYGMAHYARYVRPGARRVSVVSSNPAVKVTAFLRDGKVTIVAINRMSTAVTARISIAGIAGVRRLSLVRSSAADNLKSVGRFDVTGDALNIELPAESISTLVQY